MSEARTQLTPAQQYILEAGLMSTGFSCVLQMPTGSGKTWLAEHAMESVLKSGYRAIYLTPLRALAEELLPRWQERFKDYAVGIFTGDYGDKKPYPVPFEEAQLLIMTPERLDACTRAWRTHWEWIPQIDLIVADEFHLLGDPNRGARLEGALSRLIRLNPFARILGLSATLGNRAELAEWLQGVEYASDWRPIPLEWKWVRFKRAADKPRLLLEEVERNVQKGGKSLVFVQSRRRTQELAESLREAGVRAQHHHAGLGHDRRREIERAFREGEIEALVATSTLEMGLNLPVRQVVLYDIQRFDGKGYVPLEVNSVWQRVGRAGRPGLDPSGEAVLIAPAWEKTDAKYERGDFEPIRSALREPRHLAEQIVVEVASGLSRGRAQVHRNLQLSLAAFQKQLPPVDPVLEEMIQAGMLEEIRPTEEEEERGKGLRLRATRLGRIMTRHLLDPATVSLLVRASKLERMTFLDLLIVATSASDCQPVQYVNLEELDALAQRLGEEPSILLHHSRTEVENVLGVAGKRLLSSIHMALTLREWTRIGDASAIAENRGSYAAEIEQMAESVERILLAFADLLRVEEGEETPVWDEDEASFAEKVTALRSMIAGGLNETAATLTCVPGLGITLAKRLTEMGIQDIEDLALAEAEEVSAVRGISLERATEWVVQAAELIKTCSSKRYQERFDPPVITTSEWPASVDPYRLRRALDLSVSEVETGVYKVEGGLEPHLVSEKTCDCADAERGNLCKHVLAVRIHRGDRELRSLKKRLTSGIEPNRLDLFQLWYAER